MTELELQRSSCPRDELLLAYLAAGVSDQERSQIESHLGTCDHCVQVLVTMQRRLSISSEIPARIPASVLQRAAATVQPPLLNPEPSVVSRQSSVLKWLSAIRDQLSPFFRLPVLVPVAVTAMALLIVATQQNWLTSAPQGELSRSLKRQEWLRVTTPEAVVRAQPTSRQPSIATLKRGARVEIVGEQGEWYRVVLADGTQGWMERRAFE